MVRLDELGPGARRAPVLGVYTEFARGEPRGPAQFSAPVDFYVDLYIEAAILVFERNDHSQPGLMPAPSDAAAELELGFLVAQARRVLTAAVGGGVLHRIVKQIIDVESVPFRIPTEAARYALRTLRLRCAIDDDRWNPAGGLPEPLATLRARLPAGSYAAGQLDRIAAAIAADPARVPLEEIRMALSGIDGADVEPPAEADIVVSAAFADAAPD